MSDRKLILVIGGVAKHIPKWIHKAFDIQHIEREDHFKCDIKTARKPDLIALSKYASHSQFNSGREFAFSSSIPSVVINNGWAYALQQAGDQGLDWFLAAIDKVVDDPEIEEKVESAWRGAYNREYSKVQALEKRMKKDREKLEKVTAKLTEAESREDAAQRVIKEIREKAEKRRLQDSAIIKRQNEVLSIAKILTQHTKVINEQPELLEKLSKKIQELLT